MGSMGFVDLHSHVLPALDDGVKTIAEAVEVVGLLHAIGFEVVHATPHQKVGSWVPTADAIGAAHERVWGALADGGVAVELRLGAELFVERSAGGAVPTYTGGRAFLVEVSPVSPPMKLEEQLFRLRARGPLPVLAHPERYHSLCATRDRLATIGRSAALLVDVAALAGAHGPRAGDAARWLVADGVAHACASDVHCADDARAAADGIAWIKKRLGDAAVTRLLDENPRRILQGELPE